MEMCVFGAKPVVVLCVDDDPRALTARRNILALAGYDALGAASGEDALRILQRRHVDLVVADAFLPRFMGAKITVAIKERSPEARVVLLTAVPQPPSGAAEADRILIKGLAPSEFLAEIANLLAER